MIRKRVTIIRKEETVDDGTKNTDFIRGIKPAGVQPPKKGDYNEAVFECRDTPEYNSAIQTAYDVKNEPREDGHRYKVRQSSKDLRVTVSLTK